ncbi:MAG: hypothetical protein FWF53_05650 [Candidatus Azobacteroides sp.]|nr:hypothetical protein [Candidatus Azobacteroides sp.]
MEYSIKTERYIFNCLNRYGKYNYLIKRYRDDVLQEIRSAILVSEDETDALRTSCRYCYAMLKEFGCGREFTDLDTPYSDSGKTKEYCLPDDDGDNTVDGGIKDNGNDNGNDVLKRAIAIYKKVRDAKETCWHLGINYTKQTDKLLREACYYE